MPLGAIPKRERSCRKSKQWREPEPTRRPANPPPPKPESSSVNRSNTYDRADTAPARPSRPSPLVCRRHGAPASSSRRPARQRLRPRRVRRHNAIPRAGMALRGAAPPLPNVRAHRRMHSSARALRLPRRGLFPRKRAARRLDARLRSVPLLRERLRGPRPGGRATDAKRAAGAGSAG